jgi:hypothetical protein
MHPMLLQGDMGQVKTHFRPFGDTVNLGTMHGLRRTYHKLKNHFDTPDPPR